MLEHLAYLKKCIYNKIENLTNKFGRTGKIYIVHDLFFIRLYKKSFLFYILVCILVCIHEYIFKIF